MIATVAGRWVIAPVEIAIGTASIKGRLVLELEGEQEQSKARPRRRKKTRRSK